MEDDHPYRRKCFPQQPPTEESKRATLFQSGTWDDLVDLAALLKRADNVDGGVMDEELLRDLIGGLGLDRSQGEESNISRHRGMVSIAICIHHVDGLILGLALRGVDHRRCIIAAIADIVDRG